MITSGEGKFKVWLRQLKIGEDRIYILGGGEKPHIGGLVICQPYKKPQSISLESHYDYIVLEIIANAACRKYNKTSVAIGGIHIENASKEDIDRLIKNCKEIAECI